MGSISDIVPLLIDGKPVHRSDAILGTTKPTTDAEPVQYVSAAPVDVETIVSSSWKAYQSWSQTSATHRADVMRKVASLIRENAAELMRIQMAETNCPEYWAQFNVHYSAANIEEMAGRISAAMQGESPITYKASQTAMVRKVPIGPVLSIPPWNAAMILANRALHQPLAVGCSIVMKASEVCPKTHHYLASLYHQAGVPPGALNVVQCQRQDAAAFTEAVIAHPKIRKVEFIGSAGVGSHIAALAGKYLKPALIELGDKSPVVVLDDADLSLAAKGTIQCAFQHAGQVCFATERAIVHSSVADKFIQHLQAAAKEFKPSSSAMHTGAERGHALIAEALQKGAELIYGKAEMIDSVTNHPVILKGIAPGMKLYDEEAFAPILSVFIVNSDEEAIERANENPYGLAAGVFGKDIARATHVANQIDTGIVTINDPFGTGPPPDPVAGEPTKNSGFGRQGANYGLDQFLALRTVVLNQ